MVLGGYRAEEEKKIRLIFAQLKMGHTYSVPWLLDKDLRKPDHLRIISVLFSQVDHLVCRVLLITRARGGEESSGSRNSDGVTLSSSAGVGLNQN